MKSYIPRIILLLVVCLLLFSNVVSITASSEVKSDGPCGGDGFDSCADLGNVNDEGFHNLQGWNINEVGGPVISTSGDISKRFQLLRANNSITLKVPYSGRTYMLYAEVEDGGCDDSWQLYVNGIGPLYTYFATSSFNTQFAHQILVPASYINDTDVEITFRNIAQDNCGLAAVYFVRLSEFDDSTECQLENVPVFYQGRPSTPASLPNEPVWFDDPYGNYFEGDLYNTVGRWGCNTTCNAMITNYFASTLNSNFQTDPGVLNSWLRNNEGYNESHYVIYPKVESYASNNNIPLKLTDILSPNNERLDQHLCSGKPAMLKVLTQYGSHFVVATGKKKTSSGSTYVINDPIWGDTTLQDHYDNSYQTMYLYDLSSNRSSFEVTAHSPVHLLVTDPIGRKTGYDPVQGIVWNEIPDSSYLIESIADPEGNDFKSGKVLFYLSSN